MKTKTQQILLPTLLLGALLFTPGCSTPTVMVGSPTQSEQSVIHVSSRVPSKVQCLWLQDGASIEHNGTTPFRLVFPEGAVHKVTLLKAAAPEDVTVEIQSPSSKPSRFVMGRQSAGMMLERHSSRWESRIY